MSNSGINRACLATIDPAISRRAVGHEGEILESYVTKRRDKSAALRFLKKALKSHSNPVEIVTDSLRSYTTAMKDLGMEGRREMGR